MTLEEIAGKKVCSGQEGINTGKLGCLTEFKTPLHIISIPKGYVIPKETDLSIAFITPLIQKGTFIPVIDASAFERLSGEDTNSTNTAGIERLNLKGLPKYKFMYEEGHEFYKELSKMESFKSRDFIIIDEEGNWKVGRNSAGDYTGFTAGQVVAEMTEEKVQGGDPESKSMTIQFLDRLQWDRNYEILDSELIGYTPQEIPTVNGADLSFEVVPADTDLVIKVIVTLSSDRDTFVEGLIVGDFVLLKDGVTEAITLLNEVSPGYYDLTVAALGTGEVLAIDLFDSGLNADVIDSNGVLYRSDITTEAVV